MLEASRVDAAADQPFELRRNYWALPEKWLVRWRPSWDFELPLLLALVIGYFEGLGNRILGDAVPTSIWGMSKYGLLAVMLTGCVLRAVKGRRFKLNKPMLVWLLFWVANWVVLGGLIVEATLVSPLFSFTSMIGVIQEFALVNMTLTIICYLQCRPKHIDGFLRLLVWAGTLAAAFGVVQRVIGPSGLAPLGLLKGEFLYLNANIPETGFEDRVNGLRAFSFFDSHHAFSAFLILATLALQMMWLKGKVTPSYYRVAMVMLWAGFVTTYNLTNMATGLVALLIFAGLQRTDRGKSLRHAFLTKSLWRTVVATFLAAVVAILSVGSLHDRFIGIFDIRQSASTAGGSLAYRLEWLVNGIRAVVDYPFGFGLYLSPPSHPVIGLERYARVEGYFQALGSLSFSGDNWFQWLMVQLGLPAFLIFTGLLLIPILWGLRSRNRLRNAELRILMNGLLALLIATVVAGVSNSPILVFPPSNFLIWAAAGVVMKVPVWDRNVLKQPNS